MSSASSSSGSALTDPRLAHLLTVRDIIRYAVSRFKAGHIALGHGTDTIFDEAVFLVLDLLNLPIDQLDPWWDARLLPDERGRLLEAIDRRVEERIPAAYLTGRAYIQGIPFIVDSRVIVPRSFIGEILFSDYIGGDGFALVEDPESVTRVLDLCTGSGCLAILAARVFPNAQIDAVDLSDKALEVARRNVAAAGLEDRITLYQGSLYQPLNGACYDLIISNPPYVDAEAMAGLPPEYRHEPEMALDGGADGLDLVRIILDQAASHLNDGGALLCEVGETIGRLDDAYPTLPLLWLETATSSGEVFWVTRDQLEQAGVGGDEA